ncbi:hypothetical protein [Pseudomonas purpurea]|uniref:hypothetical protein n=1 Tax=Pseudomonas purpurea TaxID=3136737 RepID=UPI0032640560
MASQTKQQKRAKRAKVKAKQQRVARSSHPAQLGDFSDGASAHPIDYLESLFVLFQEAEDESRKDLFVTMFTALADVLSADQGLQQEMSQSGDPSETMATLIQFFLIDYRKWAHGATEDETLKWLDAPDVVADFSQAMDEVAADLGADLLEEDAPRID